jgi:tetratricopeptide (TPR) repeat protein
MSSQEMEVVSDSAAAVVSDQQERKPFPTDIQGKINTALNYKNIGNDLFKEGNPKKAIINYSKGLAFIKGLPGRKQGLEGMSQMAMESCKDEKVTEEQDVATSDLECVLKTNIAMCYIKLNNPTAALEAVNGALLLNPKAWKSLLRQAEATLMTNNAEKTLVIVADALACAPDEAAKASILRVKDRANAQIVAEEKKQKKAFGGLFDRANAKEAAAAAANK